jgi:hypothetical protein
LNTCFEPNLNSNYEDLINSLHSDDIKEKHFAVLELEEIRSQKDAKLLVSNLVGQDGKIREAVAFKINEFFNNPDYAKFFISEDIFEILFQGIMDINGNVCRHICALECEEFDQYLSENLPSETDKILARISELEKDEKQYVISKRNFQLYWCLEALCNIINKVEFAAIKDILLATANFNAYTIREKTAKIVTKLDNSELNELKEKLKNDENYYVRRYLIS